MRFETVLSLSLTFATGGLLFWGILLCYAFVVLSATIFYRFPSMERSPIYPLFYSYRDAWIRWSPDSWRNILLNFCMFLPLGILLPLGFQSLRQGWKILVLSFGSSLVIELLQLVTKRGMFEPDDLLGNAVGALIGYGLFLLGWKMASKLRRKAGVTWRRVLLAQLPLLIMAGAGTEVPGASAAEVWNALVSLGINLPDSTQGSFLNEGDGLYRFSYDLIPLGNDVLTGFVSCDYHGTAGIGHLSYHLVTCTPKKEYPLISPKEAYERIQNGKFNCYEYSFQDPTGVSPSKKKDHELQITSCGLTYLCDSKGFYQPTYEFSGMMDGKDLTILIPAVK